MRRQAFELESEEDFEKFQAEFLSRHSTPSAKVTRITPKHAASSPADGAAAAAAAGAAGSSTPPVAAGASQPQSLPEPSLAGILGSVRERPAGPGPEAPAVVAEPPGAAPEPAASSEAFPAATHRKASKFALGRRRQQPGGAESGGTQATAAAAATGAAGAAPLPASSSAAAPAAGQAEPVSDIDAQNRARLAGMSQAEVLEVLEEVTSRLPHAAIDFLRRRGARKAAGGSSVATAAAATNGAPLPALEGPSSSGAAASVAAGPPHYDVSASYSTTSWPAKAASSQQAEPISSAAAGGAAKKAAPTQAGQEGSSGPPAAAGAVDAAQADDRLVARVRWGMEGDVVGLQPLGEAVQPEQVLLRDQLRQDEGLVPVGYTLGELLLLARSAVPTQRVAALQMVAAQLARSRPSLWDVTPGGKLRPRPVVLPQAVQAQAQQAGEAAPLMLDWSTVWDHLIAGLEVVSHVRLALDADHAAVATAAAEAAAAVAGTSPDEAAVQELSDAFPLTGWPAARQTYLHRRSPSGVWEHAPVDSTGGEAARGDARQHDPHDAEEETPEDVAASDPLAGLLRMQLLQRLRYVLAVMGPPGAATPMLALLAACARSSPQAAEAVLACPSLLPLLQAWAGQLVGVGPAAAAAGAGIPLAQQQAPLPQAVRLPLLLLLRLLCQASASCARAVHDAGLLVQLHPLLAMDAAALAGSPAEALLLKLEALRTWRVCAAAGVRLNLLLDNLHAGLVRLMDPCTGLGASASAGPAPVEEEAQQQLAESLRWHVAGEIYRLLAALVAHASAALADGSGAGAMISVGCAAALANDALTWLQPAGKQRLALESCLGGEDLMRRSWPWLPSAGAAGASRAMVGVHPAALLPPACGPLGCFAAVLQFLATRWATVQPGSASSMSVVQAALSQSGLLSPDASPATRKLLQLLHGGSSDPVHGQAAQLLRTASCGALASLLALSQVVYCADAAAWLTLAGPLAYAAVASCAAQLTGTLAPQPPSYVALWPWACARLQLQQHTARLFLLGQPAMAAAASAADAAARQAGGQLALPPLQALDACLSVLAGSPAGADGDALASLEQMAAALVPLLPAAWQAVQRLPDVNPSLAAAAAGMEPGCSAAGNGSGAPYPCPEGVHPEQAAHVLFTSYAASWLSLLATGSATQAGPTGGGGSLAGAARHRLLQPGPAMLDHTQGTRLPLPVQWPLLEAHRLPHHLGLPNERGGSSNSGPALAAVPEEPVLQPHPVACALLLLLALELHRSAFAASMAAGTKLKWALHLVYVFDADELLEPRRPAASNVRAGGSGGAAAAAAAAVAEEQSLSPAWRDPLVRWAAAALTHLYAVGVPALVAPGSPAAGASVFPPGWASPKLAEQLLERFVSSSFADPLFADHVALLLLPATAPAMRKLAWATLADQRCLHLLPRLEHCIGSPHAYIAAGRPNAELASAMATAMAAGDLDKALERRSVAADVAINTVAQHLFGQQQMACTDGGGADTLGHSAGGSALGVPTSKQLARMLLRSAPIELLRRLLQAAQAHGTSLEACSEALQRACQGDRQLQERLQELVMAEFA